VTKEFSGSGSHLYMRCHKPLPLAQGMDIWDHRAFILYDTGVCGVFDLKTRDPRPVAVFPLGSYNTGVPSRDYLNHANSCMFGATHWNGNPIPLLYVTVGTGIGRDADGFFYRCAVENITQQEDGSYRGETVQTICYHPDGQLPPGTEPPCWGCPCFLVDNEGGFLYIFSARYRTKRGCVPEGCQNAFIITKFPLPDPAMGGMVRLGPEDILDQFSVPSDVQFTQGGSIVGRKLYYTYGNPKREYPLRILVFDLDQKCLWGQVKDLDAAFHREELECCGAYQGLLLCNTCEGNIYALDEGILSR